MKAFSLFLLALTGAVFAGDKKAVDTVDIRHFGQMEGRVLPNLARPAYGQPYYFTHQDLTGIDAEMLSLRNVSDRSALYRLVIIHGGESTPFAVHLRAGESIELSVVVGTMGHIDSLEALQILALDPYEAALTNADFDGVVALEREEDVYLEAEPTEDAARASDVYEAALSKASDVLTCRGYWTLRSSTYSASASGTVYDYGQVYWRNNTPAGGWYTIGIDGNGNPCGANWYADALDLCPWMAVDCQGNRYSISGTRPVRFPQ